MNSWTINEILISFAVCENWYSQTAKLIKISIRQKKNTNVVKNTLKKIIIVFKTFLKIILSSELNFKSIFYSCYTDNKHKNNPFKCIRSLIVLSISAMVKWRINKPQYLNITSLSWFTKKHLLTRDEFVKKYQTKNRKKCFFFS